MVRVRIISALRYSPFALYQADRKSVAKMRVRRSFEPVSCAIRSLRAISCSNVIICPGWIFSMSTVEVNSSAARESASRSTAMALCRSASFHCHTAKPSAPASSNTTLAPIDNGQALRRRNFLATYANERGRAAMGSADMCRSMSSAKASTEAYRSEGFFSSDLATMASRSPRRLRTSAGRATRLISGGSTYSTSCS